MAQTVWQDSAERQPQTAQLMSNQELCVVSVHREPEIQACGTSTTLPPATKLVRTVIRESSHNDAEGWILCFKSWLNMVNFFLTAWIFGGRLGQQDLLR